MEELQPEELEELVQELQEESEEEEALSPEVEELLRDLQPSSLYLIRQRAAERLGELSESSPRIVQSLISARAFDSSPGVREAAEKSLRAPVHQEILREYLQLMRQTQSATEQAVTQSGKVHNRKESKVGGWIYAFIPFGIVWVVVSGIATTSNQWDFWCFPFVALPGVGVVALALWKWRSATVNREVLLRSMKETWGTVEDLRKEKHKGEYGTSYTYCVTVRFEADDAEMCTRVMVLKAQVSNRVWKGLRSGEFVGIRYAAEDPRIALIRGE